MPEYTSYDNEQEKYFTGLLSITEYENHPYLVSPFTHKEFPIIFNPRFTGKVLAGASGGQRYREANQGHIINSTPSTIGSLMERRTRELGSGVEDMEYNRRKAIWDAKRTRREKMLATGKCPQGVTFPELPAEPPPKPKMPDKNLSKLKGDEVDRYIYENKKPIGLEKRTND